MKLLLRSALQCSIALLCWVSVHVEAVCVQVCTDATGCGGFTEAECRSGSADLSSGNVATGASAGPIVTCNSHGCLAIAAGGKSALDPVSGWVGPNTPPSTASGTTQYDCGPNGAGQGHGSSASAACQQYVAGPLACPTCCISGCSGGSSGSCSYGSPGNCANGGGISFGSHQQYPSGYDSSGNLTDSPLVQHPADSRCSVKEGSGSFSTDPRDTADCGSLPSGMVISGNQITITDTSEKTTVTRDSGGVITIDEAFPVNGQNMTEHVVAEVSSGSTPSVQGKAVSFINGTGTLQGTVVTSGTAPAGSTLNEDGTPTGSGFSSASLAAVSGTGPSTFGIGSYNGSSNPSGWGTLPTIEGSDSCTNPLTYNVLGTSATSITPDMCNVYLPFKAWIAWFLYAMTAAYLWIRARSALVPSAEGTSSD